MIAHVIPAACLFHFGLHKLAFKTAHCEIRQKSHDCSDSDQYPKTHAHQTRSGHVEVTALPHKPVILPDRTPAERQELNQKCRSLQQVYLISSPGKVHLKDLCIHQVSSLINGKILTCNEDQILCRKSNYTVGTVTVHVTYWHIGCCPRRWTQMP